METSMIKKQIKVFLVISLTAFLFFSCAAKKKEKTPVVTVAWWGDGYNKQFIDRLKKVYEKENPGVIIKPVDVAPQNYEGQILRLASADSLPDIILSGVTSYYGFAQRGLFQDLTDFASQKENKEVIDDIVSVSLESSYYKGKLYGLPIWDNVFSIFYNKDVLNRAGVEEPGSISWTEYRDLLKKVTIPGERFGLAGLLEDTFLNWGLWMMINQFGDDPVSEDGKSIDLHTDAARNLFHFIRGLHDDKLIPFLQDLENMQGTVGTFQSGNAAFQATGRWGYDSLIGNTGIEFGVMEFPHQEKDFMVNSPVWLCLSRDVKNKEEALKFMKYIVSQKGQKFVYKMRTDISIQKPILMSEDFLNSKGYPEYDKAFRKALINANFNRLNAISGVLEWDKKYSVGNVPSFYRNQMGYNDLAEKLEQGWSAEVAPLVE